MKVILLGGVVAGMVAAPARMCPQPSMWREASVGSEWEMYTRVLSLRGNLPPTGWSIRPFSPAVIERWAASIPADHPWRRRLSREDSTPSLSLLRTSVTTSFNSGFPWGFGDGAAWQGKGLNAWATSGVAIRRGLFSARFEPLLLYSGNDAFPLTPVPTTAANPFLDPQRPGGIDLPQRFGDDAVQTFSLGQTFLRYDTGPFAATLSTENLSWGPAYKNPMLLGANGPGFPHLAFGTSGPVPTRYGRFHGQLLYGQLSQSAWAPKALGTRRLGSGFVAVWMPREAPVEIGVTRFLHSQWRLGLSDILVPFNVFFGYDSSEIADENRRGASSNQLASVFFALRAPRGNLEVFGEFGRNDNSEDLRDLGVEPEHNSAWSLGFLSTWPRTEERSFWTLRGEYLSGRIAAIQRIGRSQNTFYQHSQWTQGHTVRGQLLGSPLMERTSGAEVALDRWASFGRAGAVLFERQMPSDIDVGMREAAARTQWDVGVSALLFIGSGDLSVAGGRVLDVNRFPGSDVRSWYVRLGWRMSP